jgi:primosomal protein N' (replication factor Y)
MINYYEVALLSSPLESLTYQSIENIDIHTIVSVEVTSRLSKAIVLKKIDQPDFKCKDIVEVYDEYISTEYFKIAKFIKSYYFCSIGDAISLFVPYKKDQVYTPTTVDSKIELSHEQSSALDFIKNQKVSLLFGNTGSGKTEIYMKYFEEMINSGKSVIFLLPEISLTPQMQKRLKKIFGDSVATWHSKLTKKSKQKILDDIYSGKIKIVAGARSALFLPLKNLALIVVDEEHDDAYKSMTRPRYSARDLAIYIGKVLDISVILGSATPSMTSYHKFDTIRLKNTYYETKKEFIFQKSDIGVNDEIVSLIRENLAQNGQTIIFLPTRANFKYLICDNCGKSVECPFCSVSMSLHKSDRAIKCHYCNYTERIPQTCPHCKDGSLFNKRVGTAEVVDLLQSEFASEEVVIAKFDRDEIKSESKLKKTLKEFNDNKIDILVGTQMLSKGHDYHNVRLSIILGIDSILNMSDYRARERAMSLVTQIAGRSGRKGEGRVFVQTLNSDFFRAYIHDYEDFLKDECTYRKDIYPPYIKLARVLFSHKNASIASENMQKMLKKLEKIDTIEIVGAGIAQIEKINNKYRYNILLRSKSTKELLNAIYSTKTDFCEIDIDPTSFN